MRDLRRIVVTAGVMVVAVVAIGINRIVVTDGRIDAVVATPQLTQPKAAAFKSDYIPLER